MKVLIVSGGNVDVSFARDYVKKHVFDRVIAADAGLAACEKIGVVPTDILGDFDSLKNRTLLEQYQERGVPIREFPTRKDYTDTHLALRYGAEVGAKDITLLGATGTRYDHALANIGLLEEMAQESIGCRIVDRYNEIEMLCGQTEKRYQRWAELPYFSLLAWSRKVTGLTLTGFSYPLCDAELIRGISLGISNELTELTGTLRMEAGKLLVIRSTDE